MKNLKCDPDLVLHLRAAYSAVQSVYHMNKKHWNTIILDGSIPNDELLAIINDSYDLVVKGLKKAVNLNSEAWSNNEKRFKKEVTEWPINDTRTFCP